jgi:hypothetical protein
MLDLSSSRNGAVAEAEIAAAAIRLDLVVLRPLCEGGRYDLVIDIGLRMLRVQCKWASRRDDVLTVRCVTSRRTPAGYRRSIYSADEIDAIAVYAADTDSCYLLRIEGRKDVSLRLGPTRNNQCTGVRWARDYEFGASLRRHWGVETRSSPVEPHPPTR